MNQPRNKTIWTLVVAVVIYLGVITAMLTFSFCRWRNVSKNFATTAMESIALNVENMLFMMNQYAGTFLSAFGSIQMDERGYSCLMLNDAQLANLIHEDSEQILPDFVQSNQLIVGAFFCYEPGVCGRSAYQPYYHRGDSVLRQVDDIFAFTQSSFFSSVREMHHNWWHASKHKTVFDEAVLGCCTPIYLNDTAHFVGAFVMDYSLDSMGAYLRSVLPYPSAELYIVSSQDFILAETDSLYYGKSITDVPDWRNTSTYGNVVVDFPYLPWKLAMVTPRIEIFANARSYLRWIALIAFVGLLLLSQCIYYVIRSVRRSAREQENMASEIHMAATIQRSLLPAKLPQLPDVEIDAFLQPAKEVAGDLYEVQHEGDYLYFMVGDVSGKGLQASLMMALVGGMFRMRVHEKRTPAGIMNLMNFAFSEGNTEMLFCTVLIGRLHLGSGELMLCNAGHNLPVLNGSLVSLPAGLPVGVETTCVYTDQCVQLQANDRLYCYTDGVTEAENQKHQLFGNERLLQLCQQKASLHDIHQSVIDFADGYPQSDDITLLTFTYHRLVLHSIQNIEHLHPYLYPPTSERSLLPATFYLLPKHSELAIEEAMVNPLMHGKATYVSLLVNRQSATIEDDGIPFDPTTYHPSPLTPHPLDLGGQGIALIRKITKEMHYERIGKINHLLLTFD